MFIVNNPFAELSTLISPSVMQAYVVLMILLVIIGTFLDIRHKQSARYFFENARKAQRNAKREVSSGEKAGLAVKTLTNEVLASSESMCVDASHICSRCTASFSSSSRARS